MPDSDLRIIWLIIEAMEIDEVSKGRDDRTTEDQKRREAKNWRREECD